MRILIIEDNVELCIAMKNALLKYGYSIDVAYHGLDGEEKAYITIYDMILLDLNLPDEDGIQILKKIRSQGKDIPIMIITARDEAKDKIQGLNLGADDYIIKPFLIEELRARIQAVMRRYHRHSTNCIEKGKLLLDTDSRKASLSGIDIMLATKEFDILEYLVSRYPAVVSSGEIAEHIYDENFNPFSSVLRVHLARLKKKLREASGEEVLKTMRGKGYYLCLD